MSILEDLVIKECYYHSDGPPNDAANDKATAYTTEKLTVHDVCSIETLHAASERP